MHCWGTLEQGTESPNAQIGPCDETHPELYIMVAQMHLSTFLMTPPWIRRSRKEKSNKIGTFIFMVSQVKPWSSHIYRNLYTIITPQKDLILCAGQGWFMQLMIIERKRGAIETETTLQIQDWQLNLLTCLLPPPPATVFKQPYVPCRLSRCWACRWKEKWK